MDILLLTEDADEYTRLLEKSLPDDCRLHVARRTSDIDASAAAAPIVVAKPALLAEVLERFGNLQWVQSTYAGVDPLMAPGLRRDYRLTGVKGVFGPLMSEYVIGWILARERGLLTLDAQQRRRIWREVPYRGLTGLRFGIAGLGSIGQHLAATGRHFGMRVTGYRREPGEIENVERVYHGAQLHAFLADLDYLVLTLPNTGATHHMINARALAAMAPDSCVINVGRGGVIDAEALADALRSERIGGAVLDVFEEEPLPESSPLWNLPGCHITPHVAAESFPADIVRLFLDNLERFRAGAELDHQIDFERGY